MSHRGRSLLRALWASTWLALLVLGSSCGQVSDLAQPQAISGAAGSLGSAGASALAGTAGTAADPTAVALETSDCAARRLADCQGVKSEYTSALEVFGESPELAQCSMFNSWDGCGSIQFSFDTEGCAATVAWHGPSKVETLPELRQCLSAALQSARWPCLAQGTLRYEESCFIH